jgi:hypothetical protein
MRALGPVAAALLLAAGCIPETQLRPDPSAQRLQTDGDAARAEASGLQLVADGTAWKGVPEDLERSLTPVRVTLENRSGRPVRLAYGDFALVSPESHFRYAAIPPLTLSGASLASGYGGSGREDFLPLGSGRNAYGGRWGPGPFIGPYRDPFYPHPYVAQCEERLPTQDMLEQALPEGTLESGGRVEGFLYFQGVAARERRVVLQARLVDASSGEPLGTLDIPFQVRED